jgi:CBS domain-containing protein
MKARDVMTSKVVAVHADTPTRDIARLLLENHISAVPVLEESGAPIGMVSEGDLIGRSDAEREARREWWLAMLAEGGSLNPEFLASLAPPGHTAGDVMSKPVLTVAEDTDITEIARLLRDNRIKRAPVVRDGQVVGIVSRENLLRALAAQEAPHSAKPAKGGMLAGVFAQLDRHFEHPQHGSPPRAGEISETKETSSESGGTVKPAGSGIPSAADIKRRMAEHEAQKAADELRRMQEREAKQKAVIAEFHAPPDRSPEQLLQQVMQLVNQAAERGETEVLVYRFPSELCTDQGRRINNSEHDWEQTLEGRPKLGYEFWHEHLHPLGFGLKAASLSG